MGIYTICCRDIDAGHKATIIEFYFKHVFSNIGDIRPSIITIYKYKTLLNAIYHDNHCWKHKRLWEEQIIRCALLYWFML